MICRDDLKKDFRYLIKQRGALMAKGFVIGIQFEALFQDELFYQLADHANKMAEMVAGALKKYGYSFYVEPCTNQLFPSYQTASWENCRMNLNSSSRKELTRMKPLSAW